MRISTASEKALPLQIRQFSFTRQDTTNDILFYLIRAGGAIISACVRIETTSSKQYLKIQKLMHEGNQREYIVIIQAFTFLFLYRYVGKFTRSP